MAGTYRGAWARATLPQSRVPLKPPIDPEHSRPTDGPDPQSHDMTGAPNLPVEWSQGQYLQDFVPADYVDMTPADHVHGVGFLPGVTREEAADIGTRARSEDLGNMDRDEFRPQYQEDGSAHGVIVNSPLSGASPGDLQYDEKGVGVALDPYARSNTHITHRPVGPAVFDMRWYGEQMRPRVVHNAQGSKVRGPVPNRLVNTPDSGAGTILRPDNWANTVVRRSAPQWDQSSAVDTTTQTGPADFGLGSWGL